MRIHDLAVVAGLMCGACAGPSMNEQRRPVQSIAELADAAKTHLAAKRIYFGHQSVGTNIMDGVADLVRVTPGLRLNVLAIDGALPGSGGFFAHGAIGKNTEPESKTDDFAHRIEGGFGAALDIALHKYCYVDITASTDIEAVFRHYRDTMARLRDEHPKVVFVHVTVPVTQVQSGLRADVKELLARAPNGYADNLRRAQFNERMRREYAGREPIFDLAATESTDPQGRSHTIAFKGETGQALFVPYTTDGGHLGEVGRQRVAEELLVMLAGLSSQS